MLLQDAPIGPQCINIRAIRGAEPASCPGRLGSVVDLRHACPSRADHRLRVASAFFQDDVETPHRSPGLEPDLAFNGFQDVEVGGRGLEMRERMSEAA